MILHQVSTAGTFPAPAALRRDGLSARRGFVLGAANGLAAVPSTPNTVMKPLDAAALAARVASLPRFGRTRYLASVDSTNAAALALFDDASALGLTIVAEWQTAGRGRAGRVWTSPRGSGIMMSTIMPDDLPNGVLPALGYWTSLCVAEAIARSCNISPTLKWPNDLLIGASKVCGVLIEGRTSGNLTRAAVGVGINVNRPALVPREIAQLAAWLSDSTGRTLDRGDLIAELLFAYEERYDMLLGLPLEVIHEWARRSAIAGRRLRVTSANGEMTHEGIARGISDDGGLLLQTQDGPVTVRLGDVAAL